MLTQTTPTPGSFINEEKGGKGLKTAEPLDWKDFNYTRAL